MQRPTSSDMDNTDRAKTVQKPCSHGLQNKKSHEIFRSTASTVDIPNHWDPQAKQQQRVALADFSAAPWQGFEKSERGPQQLLPVSAAGCGRRCCTGLIACGAGRRRLVRAPSIVQTKRKTSTQRVLVFLGASSDTELFKKHRSTIRFQGHRIATCLYRTPMGSRV